MLYMIYEKQSLHPIWLSRLVCNIELRIDISIWNKWYNSFSYDPNTLFHTHFRIPMPYIPILYGLLVRDKGSVHVLTNKSAYFCTFS